MSIKEKCRLYKYHLLKKNPSWKPAGSLFQGRRSAKNRASGVGQILSSSKIRYQLPLDEV